MKSLHLFNMKITFAKKEDLTAILALQKACYLEEAELYNDFSIPPLTQTLTSILNDFESETILKVEHEGQIIGSVRGKLEDNTCKIGRLIVHKEFRNQGLGSQ